ncbi:hypothetical protein LMG33818_000100 [Halomonadaceae bacterium LMG 33818]
MENLPGHVKFHCMKRSTGKLSRQEAFGSGMIKISSPTTLLGLACLLLTSLLTACASNSIGSNGQGGWYQVRTGDSMGRVAQRYHIPLLRLQRLNPQLGGTGLRAGERIRLPSSVERAPGRGTYKYIVRQGDTIAGLAREFSTSTAAIQHANPGLNIHHIGIGRLIRLPVGSRTNSSNANGAIRQPAPEPIPAGVGPWPWPLPGATVTREFGVDSRGILEPMLLTASTTYTARSSVSGSVSFADNMRQLGGVVIIHTAHDMQVVYAQCAALYVKNGQSVSTGTPVCMIKPSTPAAKAQLIFDVRHAGKPVDPRRVLGK